MTLLRHLGSTEIQLESSSVAFREGVHYRILANGCWEWLLSRDPKGYGLTTGAMREIDARAHRVALKLAGHDMPKGDHVHHRCEYPPCINAAHLEHHTHSAHLTLHKQAISALCWDDVRAIRARAWKGESVVALAKEFGLSVGTAHPLIAGRTWKDASYTRPTWTRACLECGASFDTHRPNKEFCSPEHRSRFNGRKTWRRRHGSEEIKNAA